MRILLGVLVVLVFMELVLRLTGVAFPYFLRVDRDTGFALRPHAEGWEPGEGGKISIRISSQGLRDREHSLQKPPGTFRIAVLGNSYVEAAQVPLENAFWSLLPEELSSCKNFPTVETINFGVNSYSTAQQLALLRSKVWAFQPDLIVLLFVPSMDVRKNSRAIETHVNDRPYFMLKNGVLVEDAAFRETTFFRFQDSTVARVLHAMINSSRVLQVVNERWKKRNVQPARDIPGTVTVGTPEPPTADPVYRPPETDAWKDAWNITEAILAQLHRDVRERQAEFIVFVGEDGDEVDFDDVRWAQRLRDRGLTDYTYPASRLTLLGRKEEFPVIPLAPPLLQYAREHQRFLHGFTAADEGIGHWNSEGHRVVARVMAEAICGAQ